MPAPPAIRMSAIEKRFGAVHANRHVDFEVARGTVHGLIGENGAGKSTLMSILYGFYQADSGSIEVNGQAVSIRSPADSIAQGIGMVHQHFMLVDTFTVVENVMLGAEGGALTAKGAGQVRAKLTELAQAYGMEVSPDAVCRSCRSANCSASKFSRRWSRAPTSSSSTSRRRC